MTDDPRRELDSALDAAVRGLIDDPGDLGLPADLNAQVLQCLERTAEQTPRHRLADKGRYAMVIKCGLAASILVAVAGAIGVLGILSGPSTVYAQVAERVEQLHSLVCRVQWVEDKRLDEIDGEFGKKVTFLAPSRHRIEDHVGTIQLIDTADNKMIRLDVKRKEALVVEGQAAGAVASAAPVRLVKALRDHFRSDRVTEEGVEDLDGREIDGVEAIGLRSAMNGEVVEAWVDPSTHLPLEVRIRLVIPAHLAGGQEATMWHVMSDFEYDVEVDQTLMAMEVPEGYSVVSMPDITVDRSPATLDDLISLLNTCAKHNDSLFPLSLKMNDDQGTCMAIMKQYAERLDEQSTSDAEKQAAVEKIVSEFGGAMGRANAFLFSLREENDLHYFAGARLGQHDRPLLWYSPGADGHYKVVYADLSVKDVSADALPAEPVQPPPEKEATPEPQAAVAPWATPVLRLPPQAVRDYAALQALRSEGRQATVQHLVLGLMPEFVESPVPAGLSLAELQSMPQEMLEDWKPDRSPDSVRLAFLAEFPNLKGLKLDYLYLTEKDLDVIGQCPNLERLSLSGVQILEESPRLLSGDDLQKLSGLTNLTELDLGQANFAGGLHHLSELPHLRKLYLGSFEHLNDKSVAELRVLPHLETLILAPGYGTNPETTVTDAGLVSLQKLPKLKILYVGWHGRWTMPVDRLRELLPNVKIKAGD
jgi:hypothetical protein